MYIVRDIFTAKPGMATKLAKLMKEVTAMQGGTQARVLTDAVSDYNTVVMEMEYKSLAEIEQRQKEYMEGKPEMKQKMAGYTELWLTGKRDYIYQAALLDPHTSAELAPDQIWQLVDELIEAHGAFLPAYH